MPANLSRFSVDAIKVGPWMIFAWTGVDHDVIMLGSGGRNPSAAATSPTLGLELTATYLPDSKDRERRKCQIWQFGIKRDDRLAEF